MNTESTTPTVAEIERDVEARSAVFKKELGLFDLVLTQVVFVVGTFWVGWAARLGSEQNVFWILAIVTFYLPLAAAVIFLNRLMPLEGGLYQLGQPGVQRLSRVQGGLEPLGLRDHDSRRHGPRCDDQHLVRDRTNRRRNEKQSAHDPRDQFRARGRDGDCRHAWSRARQVGPQRGRPGPHDHFRDLDFAAARR